MTSEVRKRVTLPLAIVAVLVGLLVLPIPAPCALRYLFGFPCPTCGMTRAARLALHGELSAALHMHPLFWIVLPAVVLLGGAELVGYLRTGELGFVSKRTWFKVVGWVLILAVVGVWIARFFGAFGGPVPI